MMPQRELASLTKAGRSAALSPASDRRTKPVNAFLQPWGGADAGLPDDLFELGVDVPEAIPEAVA